MFRARAARGRLSFDPEFQRSGLLAANHSGKVWASSPDGVLQFDPVAEKFG
jgi:hypothetical protein